MPLFRLPQTSCQEGQLLTPGCQKPTGLIGFEIESQPCKIPVRDIWFRKSD
jgi:hypothetical protein